MSWMEAAQEGARLPESGGAARVLSQKGGGATRVLTPRAPLPSAPAVRALQQANKTVFAMWLASGERFGSFVAASRFAPLLHDENDRRRHSLGKPLSASSQQPPTPLTQVNAAAASRASSSPLTRPPPPMLPPAASAS